MTTRINKSPTDLLIADKCTRKRFVRRTSCAADCADLEGCCKLINRYFDVILCPQNQKAYT